MPIHRRAALDALHLDGVLSLDLDRGVAAIDLARESFVDADALVGLACFIASAARDGLPVRLVLPEDPDVRSWLSRMHLGAVIEAFGVRVEGALPRVAERDRRDTLRGLERFDDAHGSDRLASFIWERLEGGADGDGDVGIGIRESLRPRYGDMTDGQAIRRAIQWHVSRIPDEGRGQGLPGVVEGVRGLDGVLWIRTGVVSRTITRRRETTIGVSRLQGTIVGARLPCRPGR
jgi:hypothetical protein